MRNRNKAMKENISRSLLMYLIFAVCILLLLIIFARDIHVSQHTLAYFDQKEMQARNAAAAEKEEKKEIAKEAKMTIKNQPAFVVGKIEVIDGNTVKIQKKRSKEWKQFILLMTDCPTWLDEINNEAIAALDLTMKDKNLFFTFDENSDENKAIHLYYSEKVNDSVEYKPVSLILVESGLAITNSELNGGELNFEAYTAAEEEAKNSRKGIWNIPDLVTSRGLNKP